VAQATTQVLRFAHDDKVIIEFGLASLISADGLQSCFHDSAGSIVRED
jgi:hypothetical protein